MSRVPGHQLNTSVRSGGLPGVSLGAAVVVVEGVRDVKHGEGDHEGEARRPDERVQRLGYVLLDVRSALVNCSVFLPGQIKE